MTRTIEITIDLKEDGLLTIDSNESESGCRTELMGVYSPIEYKDYIIDRVGKEIYSWIQLMQDEMEEE